MTWLVAGRRKHYGWVYAPICVTVGVVAALIASSSTWRTTPNSGEMIFSLVWMYVLVWGLASLLAVAFVGAITNRSK